MLGTRYLKVISYLPGSGAHRRAYNEIRAVRIVSAGVHSFLRMSRQIAPVCELILGCQIFVSNFIYTIKIDKTKLVKSSGKIGGIRVPQLKSMDWKKPEQDFSWALVSSIQ